MALPIYLGMAVLGFGWALGVAVVAPLLAAPGPESTRGSRPAFAISTIPAFLTGAGISGCSLVWFGSPFSPIPSPALAATTGVLVAAIVAGLSRLLDDDDPLV